MASHLSHQRSLDRLAEEFVRRCRDGQQPTAAEYAARYPELAAEIEELFPMLLVFEQVGCGDSPQKAATLERPNEVGPTPAQIGNYRILRCIGRGGMGVVYEAVQEPLGRHVALKVLSYDQCTNPVLMERFRLEARSAASLHHTNIVPVFDVGEEAGTCYYAMQYIHGQSLHAVISELRKLDDKPGPVCADEDDDSAQYIASGLLTGQVNTMRTWAKVSPSKSEPQVDDQRDGTAQTDPPPSPTGESTPSGDLMRQTRIEYFRHVASMGVQVAEALGYVHSHGIIHRDIKPSNLLLDVQGRVWVTDFGLAKTKRPEELTHTGDLLGTLCYMAPERFHGQTNALSDIYGLGVTLYEMLARRPAFQASDPAQLMLRITSEDPARPRQFDARVPRDLETIVMKAMDKSPARRYQTAAELASDLRRFLEDKPIRARRTSPPERLWRWCRRNPTVAASSGFAALALMLALVLSIRFALHQSRAADRIRHEQQQTQLARERSEEQRREAEWTSASLALDRGISLCEGGDVSRGMLWLARSLKMANDTRATDLECAIRVNLAGWSPRMRPLLHTFRHPARAFVLSVAFSPDDQSVLTGANDSVARLWDVTSGKLRLALPPHSDEVVAVAFAPNGRTLLTGSSDKSVRLWDITGKLLREFRHDDSGTSIAFGPEPWIVTGCHDHTARIWNSSTGDAGPILRHGGWVNAVTFSPDGRLILTGSHDGTARIWEAATGSPLWRLPHDNIVLSVAFSPDGQIALTGSEDYTARLWETSTGQPLGQPLRHASRVQAVAFHPDRRTIVTGSRDGTTQLWDRVSGRNLGSLLHHSDVVWSVVFSHDGSHILTGSADATAQVWDASLETVSGHVFQHSDKIRAAAFSPNGEMIATASDDGSARLWDKATGWPIGKALQHRAGVVAICFSRDGRTIATASDDHSARLWSAVTGEPIGSPMVHENWLRCVAISPDGKTILTGSGDKTVRLWDAATGQPKSEPLRHGGRVLSVAFRGDGRVIATSSADGTAKLWDTVTGQFVCPPLEHAEYESVVSIAFSPDGRKLLTGSWDHTGRLWDAETGRPICPPLRHRARVIAVAFSPNGKTLLTASADHTAQLWDAATGKPLTPAMTHQGMVYAAAFSPDGRIILTGSDDQTARLWDVRTGKPLGPPMQHRSLVSSVAFSPDGQTVLTGSWDTTARTWPVPSTMTGKVDQIVLETQKRAGGS
jgi:WD40 repeat protein/serine/threonine protein kinase